MIYKDRLKTVGLLFTGLLWMSISWADAESMVDTMNTDVTSSTQTPSAPTPPPAQPSPPAKPAPPTPLALPAKPAERAVKLPPTPVKYNTSGQVPPCFENCAVKNPPACCKESNR